METRRLEYFVQIIDAGSINRAAAKIGIAQPALSQQLSILEREFDARLLDRTSTGVTPTEAGRTLYVRAQVILRQIASLKLELSEEAGRIGGIVSLGLPPSQGGLIGGPMLSQARQLFPQMRLQIVEDGAADLAARLQSGLLDLLISSVRLADPALEGEPLFGEELFLIVAKDHRLASMRLHDLAALPWIVPSSLNTIRERLALAFAQLELQPNVVAEVNSLPMVIRAVQAGLGVTLLSRGAVAEALADGSLLALPFSDPAPRRTIYLYRRRAAAPSAAIDAVRALVLQIAAGLKAGGAPSA